MDAGADHRLGNRCRQGRFHPEQAHGKADSDQVQETTVNFNSFGTEKDGSPCSRLKGSLVYGVQYLFMCLPSCTPEREFCKSLKDGKAKIAPLRGSLYDYEEFYTLLKRHSGPL